ncbi:head completion/stabilization protein [Desulfoluna spongiiphila]|uniref:head completion/stabilization protein n=1 Tax=Desulfoluna spongiiphila TaxID=419481 RepID=UPI001259E927|nr:head completion/stabilization protein [Desulfoluna spongiiphila]VVS91061.1 bacteriophage head completion protein gpl [Desulfoluna spongiiphila]VVS92191.1 bacteriophage head completion protein gpl [Desulfoluna spongiiphila]
MSFTAFADELPKGTMVENNAFWPDIDLAEFQEAYRLPGEYREALLADRLRLGMLWANKELAGFRARHVEAGRASLSEVPVDDGEMLGDLHPLVLQYVRAVCCHAKGLLLSDYATMLRKNDAQSDAKEAPETADRWFREALSALADMQGTMTIHVEAL